VRPAHGISGSLASILAKLAGAQNYPGMYIRFYEVKENPEIPANGDGFYLKKAMIWSLMEGTKMFENTTASNTPERTGVNSRFIQRNK